MNYQKPNLQHLLAGEYVLGTLHGKARQRFERLLITHTGLRQEVAQWEERFTDLDSIEPITPPSHVWTKLKKTSQPKQPTSKTLWLWKGLSVSTMLTSLILAFIIFLPQPNLTFNTDYLSVISNTKNEPLWIVKIDETSQKIAIEALNIPDIDNNKDYEIWLITSQTAAPQSMGLLPRQGTTQKTLDVAEDLSSAIAIAVSLEPQGGSPTGQPTGPVLYQSTLTPSS